MSWNFSDVAQMMAPQRLMSGWCLVVLFTGPV